MSCWRCSTDPALSGSPTCASCAGELAEIRARERADREAARAVRETPPLEENPFNRSLLDLDHVDECRRDVEWAKARLHEDARPTPKPKLKGAA